LGWKGPEKKGRDRGGSSWRTGRKRGKQMRGVLENRYSPTGLVVYSKKRINDKMRGSWGGRRKAGKKKDTMVRKKNQRGGDRKMSLLDLPLKSESDRIRRRTSCKKGAGSKKVGKMKG